MRDRSFLLFLVLGLLAMSFSADAFQGDGGESIQTDRERLHAALLPTDDAGLIHFFRLRARGEPIGKTLSQLIESLRSPGSDIRQQACAELVALGTPALPLLRAAAHDTDASAADLAQRCLQILKNDSGILTTAAARLLAQRRSPDAARVLLAYLPHAENEAVLQEIQSILGEVAYDKKGIADPAVVKALSDKNPLLRLTAVVILTQRDISPYQKQLQKLLLDPHLSVRLRAALALAQASDPQAVSTLIALLVDLDDREARATIEEFLIDLADELGPKVRIGVGGTTPQKARDAWAKWWRDTDGVALLDELRKRTPSKADHDKIQTLIGKLGDDNFQVREQAKAELIRRGEPALPLLKQVLKSQPDLEMRKRSELCIEAIKTAKDAFCAQLPALARLARSA
jgi:HEAT repeats